MVSKRGLLITNMYKYIFICIYVYIHIAACVLLFFLDGRPPMGVLVIDFDPTLLSPKAPPGHTRAPKRNCGTWGALEALGTAVGAFGEALGGGLGSSGALGL